MPKSSTTQALIHRIHNWAKGTNGNGVTARVMFKLIILKRLPDDIEFIYFYQRASFIDNFECYISMKKSYFSRLPEKDKEVKFLRMRNTIFPPIQPNFDITSFYGDCCREFCRGLTI